MDLNASKTKRRKLVSPYPRPKLMSLWLRYDESLDLQELEVTRLYSFKIRCLVIDLSAFKTMRRMLVSIYRRPRCLIGLYGPRVGNMTRVCIKKIQR